MNRRRCTGFPRASDRSDHEVVLREADQGRTSLAIAPSNPDVMYALAASNADGTNGKYRQGLLAVYRSDRGGIAGSWEARVTNQDPTYLHTLILTNVSAANVQACNPQAANSFINMGWYNNVIAVDPRDPNRVWAAGVDWFRSDDGGRSWGLANWGGSNAPSSLHVDQHAHRVPSLLRRQHQIKSCWWATTAAFSGARTRAAMSPPERERIATGHAGITIAWSSLNRGYGVTQFYHGTASRTAGAISPGRRTTARSTEPMTSGLTVGGWSYGGDGAFSAVSPANINTWLMESQWASVGRTTNGGNTVTASTTGLDPVVADNLGPEGNYLFVTPFTLDAPANRIWLGGHFLFRGNDFGASWAKTGATHAGQRASQRDYRFADQ